MHEVNLQKDYIAVLIHGVQAQAGKSQFSSRSFTASWEDLHKLWPLGRPELS